MFEGFGSWELVEVTHTCYAICVMHSCKCVEKIVVLGEAWERDSEFECRAYEGVRLFAHWVSASIYLNILNVHGAQDWGTGLDLRGEEFCICIDVHLSSKIWEGWAIWGDFMYVVLRGLGIESSWRWQHTCSPGWGTISVLCGEVVVVQWAALERGLGLTCCSWRRCDLWWAPGMEKRQHTIRLCVYTLA